ncbi:MAG: ABC transporter ATP-binding protein [Halobacteriales archaeon]|nr:ABC transporter ATP-binding protein [Halobacteriales archaeon]
MNASASGTTASVEADTETDANESGAEPLLVVDGLRKTFGGIVAIDGASFEVEAETITGLVGPNGAGKSTTFNCATGLLSPDAGSVRFAGEDITGLRPYQIANRGLVRTFQQTRELADMTVLENLLLASGDRRDEQVLPAVVPSLRRRVQEREAALLEEIWETLDFFEIDHLADEYAKHLSGGQRKLLELARALMTDPDMLLLDEPFAGVNPTLEEQLLGRIHELQASGYTFLLVEHDMDLVMEHCETVIVMHQGQVLAEGSPASVRNDERVIEAYLGGGT